MQLYCLASLLIICLFITSIIRGKSAVSFRVRMGLWPTQRNENHRRRHPREGGGPLLVRNRVDSRFRGNDVFSGERSEESRLDLSFPVNPAQTEAPRLARNDNSGLPDADGVTRDCVEEVNEPEFRHRSLEKLSAYFCFFGESNPGFAFFF
jgi:hypothetical protein